MNYGDIVTNEKAVFFCLKKASGSRAVSTAPNGSSATAFVLSVFRSVGLWSYLSALVAGDLVPNLFCAIFYLVFHPTLWRTESNCKKVLAKKNSAAESALRGFLSTNSAGGALLQSAKLLFPPKKEKPRQPSQPPENPASADEVTDYGESNPGRSSFSSSQRVFLRAAAATATPGPQPQAANQQPSPPTTPGAGKKLPSTAAATDSAAPNSDGQLVRISDSEDEDDAEANDVRDVREDGDYSDEEIIDPDGEASDPDIYIPDSGGDEIYNEDDTNPEDNIGEIIEDDGDTSDPIADESGSDDDAVSLDNFGKVDLRKK